MGEELHMGHTPSGGALSSIGEEHFVAIPRELPSGRPVLPDLRRSTPRIPRLAELQNADSFARSMTLEIMVETYGCMALATGERIIFEEGDIMAKLHPFEGTHMYNHVMKTLEQYPIAKGNFYGQEWYIVIPRESGPAISWKTNSQGQYRDPYTEELEKALRLFAERVEEKNVRDITRSGLGLNGIKISDSQA